MPIVVKIATHDAAISRYSMALLDAIARAELRLHATIRPAENENAENEDGRAGEIAAERTQLRVVLRGRDHLGARRRRDEVAFDEVANVVVDEAELIRRQRLRRLRQRIEHAAAQPHGLEHLPQHEQRQRRQRAPQCDVTAVVTGQRMKAARPGG